MPSSLVLHCDHHPLKEVREPLTGHGLQVNYALAQRRLPLSADIV